QQENETGLQARCMTPKTLIVLLTKVMSKLMEDDPLFVNAYITDGARKHTGVTGLYKDDIKKKPIFTADEQHVVTTYFYWLQAIRSCIGFNCFGVAHFLPD